MDLLKLKQNLLITVNHLLTNVTLCCMKLVINIPDAYSVYFFSLQLKVLLVCLGDLVSHFMMLSEEQWWIICIVSVRVLLTSLFQGGLISPTPRRDFYLGSKVEEISKELTSVTPTCEITRSPRSLADVKDWKGN